MNDLRTAAQQALEALERADKISGYANNKKVITALKAALAQQAEPVQQVIRCKDKRENNGVCPHHNLQCGWPKCNE